MDYQQLVQQLGRGVHFDDEAGPARTLDATVTALHEALTSSSARRVLAPFYAARTYAADAAHAPASASTTLEDFYARGATLLGVQKARVLEPMQVACAVLSRALAGQERDALLRDLPGSFALLFEAPDRHVPIPNAGHGHTLADGAPGSAHSLSQGAPGSEHPLSEARPRDRQANSVAEPNPHAQTKASSSAGLTQEREHESLAEGRSKRS